MEITVLGCSGSVPGPDSPASGYLIEADGWRLGVDLGFGALGSMLSVLDPVELDALLLSHLHADHCADVSALTVLLRHRPGSGRNEKLPVYAPDEPEARLVAALAPTTERRQHDTLSDVYTFHQLGEDTITVGPFSITCRQVAHSVPTYGFRVTCGSATLTYTGDSGPCPQLDELAAGADVLLAEASGLDVDTTADHLSGTQAGSLAERAHVGRLVVTHVPPWVNQHAVRTEAASAYSGDSVLAHRWQHITIP